MREPTAAQLRAFLHRLRLAIEAERMGVVTDAASRALDDLGWSRDDVRRWLAQLGLPAVALMGTGLSDTQARRLQGLARVVLMLDGDEAGKAGAQRAAAVIGAGAELPAGSDPDDLSDDSLRELASFLL